MVTVLALRVLYSVTVTYVTAGVKAIQEGVAALTDADLNKLMTSGSTVVAGETLTLEEVMVRRTFRGDATIYEVRKLYIYSYLSTVQV
jgi:hypothetical protein